MRVLSSTYNLTLHLKETIYTHVAADIRGELNELRASKSLAEVHHQTRLAVKKTAALAELYAKKQLHEQEQQLLLQRHHAAVAAVGEASHRNTMRAIELGSERYFKVLKNQVNNQQQNNSKMLRLLQTERKGVERMRATSLNTEAFESLMDLEKAERRMKVCSIMFI